MRIRRGLVDADVSLAEVVLHQQKSDSVLLRGYVKGNDENFDGRLNGAKYSYEYIKAGKPKAGLIYYLEADNRTIYKLEFIGPPMMVRNLSEETEVIARSFRLR